MVVPSSPSDATTLAHTHGTRLVRLAHLLQAPDPEGAAADALASVLLAARRGDAHDQLLAAARVVGSYGQPPVRDDGRLEGWLDRAETAPYDVDLTVLSAATSRHLELQRRRRRTTRRRVAAAALVAAGLVGVAVAWPQGDPPASGWQVETAVGRFPHWGFPDDQNDRSSAPPTLPPAASLPASQRQAHDVRLFEVVLDGRAHNILLTTLSGVPADMLAIACTTVDTGTPAICIVTLPTRTALRDAPPSSLTDVLELPRRHRVARESVPSVLRAPTVDGLFGRTLTLDVTSARAHSMLVTYTDGSQLLGTRYHPGDWKVALFAAINTDVLPAQVAYLARDGSPLAERSFYTATP